jgi:hypothetical protein
MTAIAGFRRDVDEVCDLLGHYATPSGNPLPTASGQCIGPIFKGQEVQKKKMGPIRCPETSAMDYHSMLRNTPEEDRCQIMQCPRCNPSTAITRISHRF